MKTKILKDLSDMVSDNVIPPQVANDIRDWYEAKEIEKPNRSLLISGVLGALLTGLGIILIFAHNWDHFPKILKIILAFTPLTISQGLTVYAFIKQNETWKEATGVLLFFSIGTAISLISQIYHIPGSINNLLFTWILLGMPLIYLLRSRSLVLLHLAFTTWWLVLDGYGYRSDIPWFYLLFFSWIVPFYYAILRREPKGNFTGIISWLLPLSFTISLGAFVEKNELTGFLMYMLAFGVMYLIGTSHRYKNVSLSKNGFIVFGILGMMVLLLITSFQDLWKDLANSDFTFGIEFYSALTLFGILLILTLIKRNTSDQLLFAPFIFTAIFFTGTFNELWATILINLMIFTIGIQMIRKGVVSINLGRLNFGLLVVSTLIICRFFDTDLSFVLRGILFLVIGVGFFIANYMILKKKPEEKVNK